MTSTSTVTVSLTVRDCAGGRDTVVPSSPARVTGPAHLDGPVGPPLDREVPAVDRPMVPGADADELRRIVRSAQRPCMDVVNVEVQLVPALWDLAAPLRTAEDLAPDGRRNGARHAARGGSRA